MTPTNQMPKAAPPNARKRAAVDSFRTTAGGDVATAVLSIATATGRAEEDSAEGAASADANSCGNLALSASSRASAQSRSGERTGARASLVKIVEFNAPALLLGNRTTSAVSSSSVKNFGSESETIRMSAASIMIAVAGLSSTRISAASHRPCRTAAWR